MMANWLYMILNRASWHMEAPEMFGAFHIIAAAASILLAVSGAIACRRCSNDGRIRILHCCGWMLLLLEIFKQLFLYYIVCHRVYDWWYFPFQLCSVPMYLCLLLPVTRGMMQRIFIDYMTGFAFIGAAAAMIYPQDFLRSYLVLTLHGFIWHAVLLFISLVCGGAAADQSETHCSSMRHICHEYAQRADYSGTAILFCLTSAVAVIINIASEPYMAAAALPHKYAAMFYLNPYHLSPQPVVSNVQHFTGIPAGLLLYDASVLAAGLLSLAVIRIYANQRS